MEDESEQSDELMALQSIYEDGTFDCNISEKPFTGKVSIFPDSDAEEYNFMCNGDVIIIKHLTPLILNFKLPSNYPSVSPPDVTLSCLWLTPQQLEALNDKLNEKWTENCNSVVLFTWIDFLKTEAFEALDIKFPIDVSEEVMLKLTEESILRDEEIFSRGLHHCPVCFLEKPGTQCVRLSICGHIFCKECLSGFLTVHIKEGTINAIKCSSEGCDEQVYPNIVKNLVSQSDFDRYDNLLLQNTLDIMSDIKYCPRVNCSKPVVVEGNDSMGYCHACTFAFCTKCNLTYHGIELCKFERNQRKYWPTYDDSTEAWETTSYVESTGALGFSSGPMVDLSDRWIRANTKKCPKCFTLFEKSIEGCNKVTCVKCGIRFCWACSRQIKSQNPYDHYSHPSSPCYNRLAEVLR